MAEPATSSPAASTAAAPKPPRQNAAFRMLGIPVLPRKLPSRNWLIFWTLSASLSAAIIYDKREKKRATARWARAVAPLSRELLPTPGALPRRLTIYLEAPPGDGLRVAQDHYTEYVKPVLAASGLDWDFVQGRKEGDVRAVVAEKIRRARRRQETAEDRPEGEEPTGEEIIEAVRQRNQIQDYDGVRGDMVIGRNTWKEYIRGLHEGWLGPLDPPPEAQPDPEPEPKEGEEPVKRPPPQPKPFNTTEGYPTSHVPLLMPSELAPSTPIPFPHILGFLNTPIRFRRFLNRRQTADEIGREVAAVCYAAYREYREDNPTTSDVSSAWEQQGMLDHEERDWIKSVWKDDPPTQPAPSEEANPQALEVALVKQPEKIWAKPVVLDPRIAMRMRRFELLPEDEQRARAIIVPEEEIEGWMKGNLRSLWRWGANAWAGEKKKIPNIGNLDNE